MMDGRGKSDSRSNREAAEQCRGTGLRRRWREGGWPRESAREQRTPDSEPGPVRPVPSSGCGKVAQKDRKAAVHRAPTHVYDVDRLRGAYLGVKRDAAAGVDGETW